MFNSAGGSGVSWQQFEQQGLKRVSVARLFENYVPEKLSDLKLSK
jgi:hypothetical protein